MKMRTIVFLVSFLSCGIATAQKVNLSANDLKSYIEKQNLKVLSKEAELQAAQQRGGSFARSYLPTVELYGAQENFKKGPLESKSQPAYGAEARVNLFNGGRDYLKGKRVAIARERLGFEKTNTVYEQLGQARELYWEALYLKELLVLLNEAHQLNQKNLLSADRRIRSGVATQTDRIEFEMKATGLKREIAHKELQLKNTMASLAVRLGLSSDADVNLSDRFQHQHDIEPVLKHSHEDHHFLVKPAELRFREMELEAQAQSRFFWPKLDAYAAWNQYNQREEKDFAAAEDRRESVIGLRLIISLDEIYSGQREGAALKQEATALRHESEYLTKELDNHLHAEISELKLMHDQVHDAEENIKKAQRYYELTQSEYGRGVKNSPDVLGASEKLFEARRNYAEIIRQFQVSKGHFLAKMGK